MLNRRARLRTPVLKADTARNRADPWQRGSWAGGRDAEASSITLPKARALPGTLELGRALRPLKQRRLSKRGLVLDADATVEYFCDTGVLTPVMLPGAERWFDVDVLVDVSPSMAVWHDTAAEFVSFLERHGAFREVRRWNLEQADGRVFLSRASGVRSDPVQLVDPQSRRLMMVLTDGIGRMWYQTPIWEAIREWGMFSPVVVISPLPSRLWPRTALGSPEITLRSHRPGGANRLLDVTLPWWWPGKEPSLSAVPVPVITLDAGQVATWTRMVIGAGGVECPGVFATPPSGMATARSGNGPSDGEEQVRRFRVTISPVAYRLAVYLSAVLRGQWGLGLARVLQEAVLPDSGLVHLAEVLVGGLVRQAERTEGQEEPTFEFIDSVANVLQRSLTGTEALRLLQALGGYIERETGRSPGIAALLLGEATPADASEEFADVRAGAAALIDTMGLARTNVAPQQTADSLADATEEANHRGEAMYEEYERTGSIEVLQTAITLFRETVDSAAADHPRTRALTNLAAAVVARFRRTGQQSDLDQAIALFGEAVEATPPGHSNRPGYLSSLGDALLTRSDRTGQQADLDQAIALLRQAVEATPPGHSNRPGYLSSLGHALLTRSDRTGQQADLDQAIALLRQAVEATPPGHSNRPGYLSSLGHALLTRSDRTGQQADLDQAIALLRQAVEATPPGHSNRPGYLSSLGIALSARFDRTRQQADLDEAIALFGKAADAATPGHPNRPRRMSDLVDAPETGVEYTGQQADLDVADVAMTGEADEQARVLDLLRRLPLRQRQVMALAYDGYTPEEIASLLGMEPTAVRVNLQTARERLREYLGQEEGQTAAEQERLRSVPLWTSGTFEDQLASWVVKQRWFAGKGRTMHDLAIVADTEIVPGDPGLHHLIVTVSDGATSEAYQIFAGSRARLPARLRHARIGRGGDLQVYDGLYDSDLTRTLLDAIVADRTIGALRFCRIPGADLSWASSGPALDSLVLTGEQRNTSVTFGEWAIFKVFGRVAPGPNPDLEVAAALAELGSTHVAEPYGWVETRIDGRTTVLAILSRYLRAASDGWSLATTSVRELYESGGLRAAEAGGDFAEEAGRLGAATAQVHADLAEAFGTSELEPEAIRELAEQMFRRLDIAFAAVPELARYADMIGTAYSNLARLEGPVPAQRVHGDYHLGEVMRTQSSWVVLDFEGDPATPLAQRRARTSPLRDVAGMLRSFDYAARSQLITQPRTPELAAATSDWIRRNSDAFSAGYTAAGGLDLAENSVLLRALLLDKAVNEVVYEARNRPSWLPIPLESLAGF